MVAYKGFSTINSGTPRSTNLQTGPAGGTASPVTPYVVGNQYGLVDTALVIQDFINALNIQQGQKVGQPGYGTTLWSFVFEPNTADVQFQLENEIRRVASQDPRLLINTVKAYPQENGILLEVEMAVSPFNQANLLSVFFSSATNQATIR
jgi:phage baseplate assembly protein W